ncbi:MULTISPECIES: hypothetical protein [Sphingomonas]|uniref:hypothetical protein n=1 Tax=Sphingomonas TaxID=13687 RepID=UPI000DEEF6D4|nr:MULTISPECIES: hypothetical protein [Sphingomonas]
MRPPAPPPRPSRQSCRRDGWTVARQLAFLDSLARTRHVGTAAAAAGMSREGAYRLRDRQPDGLFAAMWQRAMTPPPASAPPPESHMESYSDGRLMRLLGDRQRRNSAAAPTSPRPEREGTTAHRAETS